MDSSPVVFPSGHVLFSLFYRMEKGKVDGGRVSVAWEFIQRKHVSLRDEPATKHQFS